MAKFVVPFALFLLLGVFLFIGLQRDPSYVPSPLIGKPAPQFSLPSLQDAAYPVSSQELLGQPWVLNVWGTWCGGCRQELREFGNDDVPVLVADPAVVRGRFTLGELLPASFGPEHLA